MHIKDGKKRADPDWHDYEYTKIGEGQVPIKEIISLLKENGYNGYLSLEWENGRPELKELNIDFDTVLGNYVDYIRKCM